MLLLSKHSQNMTCPTSHYHLPILAAPATASDAMIMVRMFLMMLYCIVVLYSVLYGLSPAPQ